MSRPKNEFDPEQRLRKITARVGEAAVAFSEIQADEAACFARGCRTGGNAKRVAWALQAIFRLSIGVRE